MGTRTVLAAIGCGALSALLFASLLAVPALGIVLSNFAALPVMAVGLAAGSTAALVAGAAAAGLLAAWVDVGWSLGFLIAFGAPALYVVRRALARRTDPATGAVLWAEPGDVLVRLVWIGAGIVLLAAVLVSGTEDGLRGLIRTAVGEAAPFVAGMAGGGAFDRDAFVSAMVTMLPGPAIAGWILFTIANAALAQGLLMRMGRNMRPPMRVSEVEVPFWTAPAFAIACFAWAASPTLVGWYGFHVASVLAVAYVVAGLSVIHAWAATQRMRLGILVAAYGSLLIFAPATVVVAGIGFIEHWARLKRRFGRTGRDLEDRT
jgi:hypothetical protein